MGENKKKTSIFFRSLAKDGKGVSKDDVIHFDKYNLVTFFKLYGRRFSSIVKINWLYIFGNFPILFLLLVISGNFSNSALTPQSQYYPVIYGMMKITGGTAVAPMLGIHGIMGTVTSFSVVDYILLGFSLLFLVTFGYVNASSTYLMRNIVRGEHLFMMDDIRMTIKQNKVQALVFGIIDLIVLAVCAYAITYYINYYQTYYVLFFCALAVTAFYIFIRQYVYLIMVTFELPLWKILKNAFIMATLSLGRCFLALIINILLIAITLSFSMIFTPIGIIILLMLLISTTSYVFMFFTFPKMKTVMIDPYYPNYGKEPEETEEEPDPEVPDETNS